LLLESRIPPVSTLGVRQDFNQTSDAEILFANFREEDVLARELVTEHASLKNIIKNKNGMKQGAA